MKKIIFIISVLINTITFAQCDTIKDCLSPYISYGLSVTNGDDFKNDSYTSLEGGVMCDNFGIGLALGRGSLDGMWSNSDKIKHYYYEIRMYASYPMGLLTGSFILGYGGYFNISHNFIEYGFGVSRSMGKVSYGVCYSNWDGTHYLTPNVTYNF
jgi:hypothetical protein